MLGTESQAATLAPGALVGARFKVLRCIGRGGMGEVYAARHVVTGRDVALKIIRGADGAAGDRSRRFLREARAAAAIQHPSVIEVLDVFEDDDGAPVMVMELLEGEPLSALLAREGKLPLARMAALLAPVTAALIAAHDKGIVHRDLKPDNIFLAVDGGAAGGGITPKVLDFGIAKVLDPARLASETGGGSTGTGSLLGTPHYMSYEQAMSDKTIDQRTDVWSLGVIAFELLVGRRPLVFESLGEMYRGFLQGQVPSLREAAPDLPEDVVAVVDHCLRKNREARLADLRPLLEVLCRYVPAEAATRALTPPRPRRLTDQGASWPRRASPGRPRRPVLMGVVGALFLALGSAGALWVAAARRGGAVAPAVSIAAPVTAAPSAPSSLVVVMPAGSADPAAVPGPSASPSPSMAPPRPAKTAVAVTRSPASPATPAPAASVAPTTSGSPEPGPRGIIKTFPY